MSLIRLNKEPSRRQLAVFGLAWLVVLGLLGGSAWLRSRPTTAELLWILAVTVPSAGGFKPRLLRHVYVGLSYATYPIGFVLSHVVLALVYYLVLTPIGLTLRLFRHDPLGRRFDPKATSYWTPRTGTKTVESYFRQS